MIESQKVEEATRRLTRLVDNGGPSLHDSDAERAFRNDLRTVLQALAERTKALEEIDRDHNSTSQAHPIAWWIDRVWSYKRIARQALSDGRQSPQEKSDETTLSDKY